MKSCNNKRLVNFLIHNNICFSNISLNNDSAKYIWLFDIPNSSQLFNIYEQIGLLNKVKVVLKNNILKKKPIMFFGLNHLNFSVEDFFYVSLINKEIFKLCFYCFNKNVEERFYSLLDFFYKKNYDLKAVDDSFILQFLKNYNFLKRSLLKIVSNKENSKTFKKIGFFFPSWVPGYFSNYHLLNSQTKIIKKSILTSKYDRLKEIGVRITDSYFFNKIRILYAMEGVVSSSLNMPGVVVFFSKEGYESFLKEFYKLGIPVICIVDNDVTSQGVDYPLLGDSSDLNTLFFYQQVFKYFLKNKKIIR